MKTVILAAGIASRLKPLTDNTPKCLLRVGGKSILEMAVENILEANIKDIIIVTGYLEHKIREYMKERFPQLSVTYIYNEHYKSTNNIYSLWLTKKEVIGDDMIMMDSDIVFDKRILTTLINSEYKSCLALKRHEVNDEEIKVKADKDGRVLDISKEVNPSDAAGESIGIELFKKEALAALFTILDRKILKENNINVFYETAFQEMTGLYIVDTTEYFCMEIDTASDLIAAEELVLNNINLK
jgi:choline kinase